MSFYYKRLTIEDGTTDLHSVQDHSIDPDKSDRKAYVEEMKRKHLVPKAGERLARFEVAPISRRDYEAAQMEAGARGNAMGMTTGSIGTLLSLMLFDRCCVAVHDVWLDHEQAYGTVCGELLESTDQMVRLEIGGYCNRLYGVTQPDFFGLLRSQRSAEEAAQDSKKADGPSVAETADDTQRTDES